MPGPRLPRASQIRLTLFISVLAYFYLFEDGETVFSGTRGAAPCLEEGEGWQVLLFTTPH